MANPSNVGGTEMLDDARTYQIGAIMEATGTSQSVTLNPHKTYAIINLAMTAAAPPVAATEAIYFNTSTATVSSVSGANKWIVPAGGSVSGIGPGLSTLHFIGGAASLAFSIYPSASRFGKQ